ncbi:MAG: DUF1080 domain-containing protein [Chthonomonas sp.]|nr:DUF1080 domain-containing protein [Chthonomonas sp.]
MLTLLVASATLISPINTLTLAEQKAGWQSMFDGKSFAGWHNYRAKGVRDGWTIKDGVLRCNNPAEAGDLISEGSYKWFELDLEFNMDKDQNSGVMFHVDESEQYPWMTGPEVQIYDHKLQEGVESTGCLYQFYRPSKDTAKPAGQWNRMQVRIAEKGCWVKLNGTKAYDFKLGSEDWNTRLAKTKFAAFKNFGKLGQGSIAIQGDHGVVSFRNIKIKELK